MEIYSVELWVIHNMQDEVLESYELFLSLEDAQASCITGYVVDDHEYIKMMDRNGACRRIVTVDLGE